jgi:hypothetical protein
LAVNACTLLYGVFHISFQLFGFYWQVGDDVKVIDATGKFVMPG